MHGLITTSFVQALTGTRNRELYYMGNTVGAKRGLKSLG
jgi:hypothetical protein